MILECWTAHWAVWNLFTVLWGLESPTVFTSSSQYCISSSPAAFMLKNPHTGLRVCKTAISHLHTWEKHEAERVIRDWKRERTSCTHTPIRGIESGKYFWKKRMTSSPERIFSNSSKGMKSVHVNVLSLRNQNQKEHDFLQGKPQHNQSKRL